MPLCARDVSLHNILSCADYISPTHIFLSFDHTQSPPIVFKYYFSFILFYFMVFFTDPPWLFRQRPLIPCIFLFFAFQRQEVFLSPLAKSTKAQYSCGSHIDMFRCSNNIWIPNNAGWYKISKYILLIFDIFLRFRSTEVFFFLYHLPLCLFFIVARIGVIYVFFYFFIYFSNFS